MGRLSSIAVLFLLIASHSVSGQNHALLIDNSGSMRPYYQSLLIRDLGSAIENVLKPHGSIQVMAFSTDVVRVRDVDELTQRPLGEFTYLDRALDETIRQGCPIVWMITDNVQSQAGEVEEGNTEMFYRRLRSPSVNKVVIFPLLQSPGTPGIVIYALQLSPDLDKTFQAEIAEFLESTKGTYTTDALRLKPLDREAVDISLNRETANANKGVLYKAGQDISESLDVRFKSRFDHLKIVDSKISVSEAEPEFAATSLLRPEKTDILINPERILSLEPNEETAQLYRVTMNLGKVGLKKDLHSWWQAAWGKNYEDVSLNASFVIEVPQENFRFKESFLKKYDATNPVVAKTTGKIYGLARLPLAMTETSTSIPAEVSLPFRVQYPWWPAFFWILLFLLAIGGITAIAVALLKAGGNILTKSRQWAVSAETNYGAVLKCEVADGRVIMQSEEIGSILKNTFRPVNGINADGGQEKIKLQDGLRVKIEDKGTAAILVFEEQKNKDVKPSYTPETR